MSDQIFDKHLQQINDALPDIVTELTINARVFFDTSFENKGFTDKTLKKWKPVLDKEGNVKERPLVDSADLRNSFRTESKGLEGKVYTDVTYAPYHNDGGEKKGRPPKRQFMGESEALDNQSIDIIESRISEIIK